MDVGRALQHVVVAGDAAVEYSVFDVASNLLGAQQNDLQVVIVDGRIVRARRDTDVPAGAFHHADGGVLQRAFGQAQAQQAWVLVLVGG